MHPKFIPYNVVNGSLRKSKLGRLYDRKEVDVYLAARERAERDVEVIAGQAKLEQRLQNEAAARAKKKVAKKKAIKK